jgi:integrase
MSKRVDNFALAAATGRTAFASDGTPFDPSADVWSFRTRSRIIVLNFGTLREMAGSCLVQSARRPLRSIVETRNLNTVTSAFQRFRSLLMVSHQRRNQHVEEIDAEDIAVWISLGNARYLGQIRVLTNAWQILKSPGFEAEAFAFLDRAREPSKDNYVAVRTWDPGAGPYRPAEDAALKSALDAGFNDGRVRLYQYALVRTLRGIGMRPAQLAAMKVCDLRRDGGRVEMRIPLAKQRGIPERGAFMPWKPITQGLADILFLHIAENVGPLIGPDENLDLAPLFPPRSIRKLAPSEDLSEHTDADALAKLHATTFKKLGVISPLTGEPILVNPRRERHTVLTSLAMNGCNSAEIAANAGHADLRSCEAYVEASVDHFQRMERLVGRRSSRSPIASLARSFARRPTPRPRPIRRLSS